MRRSRALDNCFVERLWHSVKDEEVYVHDYATTRKARRGLARYFDYYNHQWPHQTLGYRTRRITPRPVPPLMGGGSSPC